MRSAPLLMLLLAACGSDDAGPRPLTFGGDRPVDLKVPPTLTPGKKYPLVMVLHGYGVTGMLQAAFLGVSRLPNDDQALLLAPDGLTDSLGKQFWNADPECCDKDGKNPDDVGYLGGLIDDVMATWPVDPKQVFVIGHSNGGFMSYRMACERADVIAAIGPLAGLASSVPAMCNPSQPVNVLHMHGSNDTEVPYGPAGVTDQPGAMHSVEEWAHWNGCRTTLSAAGTLDLVTDQPGAETQRQTVDGCPEGGAIELWTIQGAEHVPVFGSGFAPALMQWLTDHRRS